MIKDIVVCVFCVAIGYGIAFVVYSNKVFMAQALSANAQGAVDVMKLVCPKLIKEFDAPVDSKPSSAK